MKTPTRNALSVTTPNDREIVLTRVFDAPARLIFEAHTKPELVKRWLLGPPGWSMPVCQIDLKVGGAYRYVWRREEGAAKADCAPEGGEFAMGGVFREIVPHERIVATEQFEGQPGESVVTTTFVERGGQTTLTCTCRYDSRETRDAVLKSGMEHGVAISYDRLDDVLAEPKGAAR